MNPDVTKSTCAGFPARVTGSRCRRAAASKCDGDCAAANCFYVAADQRLTSVPVTFAANGTVALGPARPLFRTEIDNTVQTRQQYMVSADGQRFLVNALTDASDPPSNTVILNWKGKP